MRPAPRLARALFLLLLSAKNVGHAAQIIALSPDTEVPVTAVDYDPSNPDQDRFAKGSDLETPALTYFAAAPSKVAAASVIICPGGGYGGEAVDKEGYKPALWLNSLGLSAFVLRYRLPHGEAGRGREPVPLTDLQDAIKLVRRNAQKWGLDPMRVGVMGWSAGGHLAAMGGTLFHDVHWWDIDPRGVGDRPDFLVLMYPVITMTGAYHIGSRDHLLGPNPTESAQKRYSTQDQVTGRTPPTFIAVASDDDAVPLENSLLFAQALKASRVPYALALYVHGGHGFGMGKKGTDSVEWPKAFSEWARFQGLLPGSQER